MKALVALGDEPEDVAESLYNLGYKGERCNAAHCPVAHYLKQKLGEPTLWVDCGEVALPGEHDTLETPAAVFDFIQRFDFGEYPELEEAVGY